MDQDGVKEAIMDLYRKERVVAVALKHVFDQIKGLKQEEKQEIQSVKQKYYPGFQVFQDETNKIIKGNPIEKRQMKECLELFKKEDPTNFQGIGDDNKKIDGYWQKTLFSFYGEQLTQADREIAKSINAISLSYFKDYIHLQFQIGSNSYIGDEFFTKRCQIEDGCLVSVYGGASWLKPRPDGIFGLLFSEKSTQDHIESTLVIAQQFIVEIVPYSLQHYLGANDDLNAQEDQDEMVEGLYQQSVGLTKKLKE